MKRLPFQSFQTELSQNPAVVWPLFRLLKNTTKTVHVEMKTFAQTNFDGTIVNDFISDSI